MNDSTDMDPQRARKEMWWFIGDAIPALFCTLFTTLLLRPVALWVWGIGAFNAYSWAFVAMAAGFGALTLFYIGMALRRFRQWRKALKQSKP